MINISDIRNLIEETKVEHLMGMIPDAPSSESLSDIICVLAKPENLTDSGYSPETGARDYRFENDDYILEVELPS